MNKITPFLWFNDNAEDAAEFYLSVFQEAKKVGELRSSGVGPWPAGKIATITIELMGQQMTFLNGGPAQALTPAFSYSVACKDQAEIDRYWDKLLEGGPAGLAVLAGDGRLRVVQGDELARGQAALGLELEVAKVRAAGQRARAWLTGHGSPSLTPGVRLLRAGKTRRRSKSCTR